MGLLYFRGLKIVTRDVTLNIIDGQISIRIWSLNSGFKSIKSSSKGVREGIYVRIQLPSFNRIEGNRVNLRLDGVEIFVYNNSNFYDGLLKALSSQDVSHTGDRRSPFKALC